MKILSFGEVLWDVYPHTRHIGGAPLNFAAHAAKLGSDVFFASCVGNDEEGRSALSMMQDWGICTSCVSLSNEYATGKCIVSLDKNGIPSYNLLSDTAYDHIPAPQADFDVLYFGTLSQRGSDNLHTLKNLLKKDYAEIFADINIRPPFVADSPIALCLENATILKVSSEELHYISDNRDMHNAAKELLKLHPNIKIIIITMGEHGALAYDGSSFYYRDAEKTTVCSTVGAGDSFCAAFLVNYLNGKDLETCLDSAVKLSAFVVSQQAAIPDYDGRDFI